MTPALDDWTSLYLVPSTREQDGISFASLKAVAHRP